MNNIDLITLEHMSNSNYCYHKPAKPDRKVTKADKKFYRKRIIHETKAMFKNEFKNTALNNHFHDYIFSLISYFKMMDKIDIIQTDYNGDRETEREDQEKEKDNITNLDKLDLLSDGDGDEDGDGDDERELDKSKSKDYTSAMFSVTEQKKLTLDNFVKSNKPKFPIYTFPTQKEIDLKQPALKEKGISSKTKSKELTELSENNKEILYNGETTATTENKN